MPSTYEKRFHTSALRYKDTANGRPGRRRQLPEDIITRRLDLRISSKDTVPTQNRRRELAQEKYAESKEEASKRTKILHALKRTREFYRTSRMTKTSDVSQLEGLDPEGVLWPQFELMVKQALDGPSYSKKRSGIIGDLWNIKKDDHTLDTEQIIRFGFLDFVLDNGDVARGRSTDQISLEYPTEWYPQARQMQRVIHLHVGPTNSGKTYNALKRLEQAQSGFYAGPLRLLAHEVYSRFNSRGIKCDLVTGDDVRLDESGEVELYASTVEMVECNKVSDVGVVDEIQMIGDSDRGWAWTRALLGAKVKELHLCGEARVVPLIRAIVASMGDTLHIHQYERLNPLKVMSRSLKGNLQNLRKGDCVVSFSIVNIHALKRQIELDTGKRCAIIYGGLPPETRAQQAALFNDPDNEYDFLAASDAIGMGLNLSIKRIVFETTRKYNGSFHEQLSVPQIKQIAGRAGRYRTAQDDKKTPTVPGTEASSIAARSQEKVKSIGLVTCLDEADLPVIQHALSTEGAPLKAAGILPPGELYEDLASRLPEDTPFEYILRRMNSAAATHDRFRLCDIRDQVQIARILDKIKDLSIAARLTICAAPASVRGASARMTEQALLAMANAIEADTPTTVVDINEIPLEVLDEPMSEGRRYLESLEALHKILILYLWLSYRFPRTLRDQDMAVQAKQLCEEKINTTLLKFSANPKLRHRLAEIRKSSEMLRDRAKANGWIADTPLIMNPDLTVEEIDSSQILDSDEELRTVENSEGLENKVAVHGELDVGNDDNEVMEVTNLTETTDRIEPGGELPATDDDHQRARGTG